LAINISYHNAARPAGGRELMADLACGTGQIQLLTVVQTTGGSCYNYLGGEQKNRSYIRGLRYAVNDRLDGGAVIGQHGLFQAMFGHRPGRGRQQFQIGYGCPTLQLVLQPI
jgi:hypothetical protein